jgi:hypothetical protein
MRAAVAVEDAAAVAAVAVTVPSVGVASQAAANSTPRTQHDGTDCWDHRLAVEIHAMFWIEHLQPHYAPRQHISEIDSPKHPFLK